MLIPPPSARLPLMPYNGSVTGPPAFCHSRRGSQPGICHHGRLAGLLFGRLWALTLVLVLLPCVLVLPASFFIHGRAAEASFGG
jgi:hypothetical protein